MRRLKDVIQPGDRLSSSAGTYALWFWLDQPLTLSAGRLGEVGLGPGAVVYVGSAHGPGGLRARVSRHLRERKKSHWHIDALTAQASVTAVWYTLASDRLECQWAARLQAVPGATIPVSGFGASDCRCPAHLFALPVSAMADAWQALDCPAALILWPRPQKAVACPASGECGHITAAGSRIEP